MPADSPVDFMDLCDLCTPWCVHVVATLRVAQHLKDGPLSLADLAQACAADADALGRVLRHLVSKGVFEEPSPGQFALNEPAHSLLDAGAVLSLDLDGFGGRMAHAWGTLLQAVRTGAPAYHTVFGRPFWEDLEAHPELAASFDALMGPAGHGVPDADVLPRGDWDSVQTVVDVGGGTGALLAAILRDHPGLQGILVDRPPTIARAGPLLREAGVADRVTLVGQSFFDPLPAGADLYLLKNVLGDWPDREARAILTRCAEAARPAGRIVLIGGVSPDDGSGPGPELLMLVLVGGKGRTLSEFKLLAAPAGLEVDATGRTRSGRFLVQCRPTSSFPSNGPALVL